MTVLLAHARGSASAVLKRLSPEGRWLYAGTDERQAARWAEVLGPGFSRIDLTPRIDAEAARLRGCYLGWMARLSERYRSDPHWWCGEISERNTLLSPLYLRVCCLSAIRSVFETEEISLVVAESADLASGLELVCERASARYSVAHPSRRWIDRGLDFARLSAGWGICLVRSVQRKVNAWRTRSPDRGFYRSENPRLLIRTHVHPGDLSPDGSFRDRYFPGLTQRAAERGYEAWILPTPHMTRWFSAEYFRGLRGARERFIIPEDWLSLEDYIEAWRCALRLLSAPEGRHELDGLDITPLVENERLRQGASRRSLEACLLRRLPLRLREAGFQPKFVIDWYENQIISKALVLGMRSAYPDVEIRGFYGPSLLKNLLNLYPTPEECRAGVAPDAVICSIPMARDILTKESGGMLKVFPGGSTRHSYLEALSKALRGRSDPSAKTSVLIVLPQSLPVSALMVRMVADLARRSEGRGWLIKPHGDYGRRELLSLLPGTWPESMRIVEGALSRWFEEAGVVVSAESWTAVEAAACGLPVVLFRRPQSLDFDPFGWMEDVAIPKCSDSAGLERALDDLKAGPAGARERRDAFAERILSACVAPAAADPWQAILADAGR